MSNRVVASIEIAAPPQAVWDVIMDPDRLGEWVTIHRKLGKVSQRPPTVGTTIEQGLSIRGGRVKVTWTVERADAPEEALWKGVGPARAKAETVYRLSETADGGTKFDYEMEFKPPLGPLGAAAAKVIVGGVPEREAKATLAKLKGIIERS
jgi:uncharacterized protein YndB with AHSA1/START domain